MALRLLPLGMLLAPLLASAQGVDRREEGPLVLEDIPVIPAELEERLLQYQNTRAAVFSDWLPDGDGLLIRTRFGDTYQFHVVEEPGGARRQVTFFDEPVGGGEFPETGGSKFLFNMDSSGNEVEQFYLFDLETGRHEILTDGETRHRSALWANTSEAIAYTNIARNGRDYDIYIRQPDAPAGEGRMVYEADGAWYPMDFSPGDDRMVIGRTISANESEAYELDLATGETTKLNATAEGPVSYGSFEYAPDGEGLYYTSDEGGEFKLLRYMDLRHGISTVLADDISWDVEGFALSGDGDTLAFGVNASGKNDLHLLDTTTLEREKLDIPAGIVSGIDWSPDDSAIAFSLSTSTAPTEVYTYNLASEELTRWTYSEMGGLSEGMFSEAEFFYYPTFDELEDGTRRTIPAFVYRPKTEGPHPVIVDIHGGPASQARPYFSSLSQFYVNELGAAVIYPNVRGSRGYGKSFLKMDNGMLREDSVKDIGALLDWIELQPDLDESRVAVIGGSYGGYMVLASLVHYSDRLAAGVSIVGISNFVTFLESTSEYRRDLRRAEYGDERDPEMRAHLESISPTNNAEKIQAPLMVAQGFNDPRVPYTESEQIVEEVRANGQPVWYFLAMNEGHGFARKENRDKYQAAVVLFFKKHLLGEAEVESTDVE